MTKIEIIVVLVLVGLIMVASAPSYVGFIDDQRLTAAHSGLINDLRAAQQMAVSRRAVVTVGVLDKGYDVVVGTAINRRVRWDGKTTTLPALFIFNSLGEAVVSTPVIITIDSPCAASSTSRLRNTAKMIVSPTGKRRMVTLR